MDVQKQKLSILSQLMKETVHNMTELFEKPNITKEALAILDYKIKELNSCSNTLVKMFKHEEGTEATKSADSKPDSTNKLDFVVEPVTVDGPRKPKKKEWSKFTDLFKVIHNDDRIGKEVKLNLLKSMFPKSKATEPLMSLQPIAENYDKVVEALRQSGPAESAELQIYLHTRHLLSEVRELIDKRSTNFCDKCVLSKFQQFEALDKLGLTYGKCGIVILTLLESTLPQQLLCEWLSKVPSLKDTLYEDADEGRPPPKASDLKHLTKFLETRSAYKQQSYCPCFWSQVPQHKSKDGETAACKLGIDAVFKKKDDK